MPKAMFTRENGPKIKPTGMVFTLTLMEADMRANGFKINSTDLALSSGPMVLSMRVSMSKE